ncbi:MAG: tRNA lysidine(34) synthetase TilS [Solirubrobacteraceae bacterium]
MEPGIVERVGGAVAATGLLHPGDPLIVLVSGGRDSVCLLDVAVGFCGPAAVLALHVDYGLRGAESDADVDHVRVLCRAAGVALKVRRAPAPPAAGNREAWARDVRYAHALALARAREARIAAGHTAGDQVETILYRLAASPGRRALLGMAAVDGLLIRPLLGVSRAQTGDYCRARGLAWRDDASNSDGGNARGRCRHGLAAALAELHPAAEQNILQSARLLREEAAVLDEVVATALAGRRRIALERLGRLPPALARLVVVRLAEDALGGLVPGAGSRVDELLALAPAGGSAKLDVGGGCRAVVEYGVLRFEAGAVPRVPEPVALAVPGTAGFGAWLLVAELAAGGGPPVGKRADGGAPVAELAAAGGPPVGKRADGGAPVAELSAGGGPPVAEVAAGGGAPSGGAGSASGSSWAAGGISAGRLDADALGPGGLTVRGWRDGDRMAPVGLGGTKSLADLFVDRRVPRSERRTLPVVVCAGEVAWVPGVATGERFRVGERTMRIVVISARRAP